MKIPECGVSLEQVLYNGEMIGVIIGDTLYDVINFIQIIEQGIQNFGYHFNDSSKLIAKNTKRMFEYEEYNGTKIFTHVVTYKKLTPCLFDSKQDDESDTYYELEL